MLAWSDTKVIQACFEYGLVAEGDDSGGQTLRERLVELLQTLAGKLHTPSQQTGPSFPMGVGQAGTTAHSDANDGPLSSDSGLLRTPGGRFVTPPPPPRGRVDTPAGRPLSRLPRERVDVHIATSIPSPSLWTLRTRP